MLNKERADADCKMCEQYRTNEANYCPHCLKKFSYNMEDRIWAWPVKWVAKEELEELYPPVDKKKENN